MFHSLEHSTTLQEETSPRWEAPHLFLRSQKHEFPFSFRCGNSGKLLLTPSIHRFSAPHSKAKSHTSREKQINTSLQTSLGSKGLKYWGKSLNQSDPSDKSLQKSSTRKSLLNLQV